MVTITAGSRAFSLAPGLLEVRTGIIKQACDCIGNLVDFLAHQGCHCFVSSIGVCHSGPSSARRRGHRHRCGTARGIFPSGGRFQIGHALHRERRRARRDTQQQGFFIGEVAGRDALDGAHRADAAFLKFEIERIFDQLRIRQNVARQAGDFERDRLVVGKARRVSRATMADWERPSAIISSPVGWNKPLSSQRVLAVMPRLRMSSVKEVSLVRGCCMRVMGLTTNVPEPWRRTRRPSRTRSSTALRTVTRLTHALSAMSRSAVARRHVSGGPH